MAKQKQNALMLIINKRVGWIFFLFFLFQSKIVWYNGTTFKFKLSFKMQFGLDNEAHDDVQLFVTGETTIWSDLIDDDSIIHTKCFSFLFLFIAII